MTIHPDVLARIEHYAPKRPEISQNWPMIADTVRAAVIAARPQTAGDAYELCSRAAALSNWCVRILGVSNDPQSIFTERNILRWGGVLEGKGRKPTSVAPELSRLRVIMRGVTGNEPRAPRKRHEQIPGPYSRRELASHLSWATTRDTQQRRETATAALALGAGAGLRNREVALVEESDLDFDADGAWVNVKGATPRRVPIVDTWVDPLRSLLRGEHNRRLVVVGVNTSGLVAFSEFDDETPPFNMYRLRTTWCVAAMQVLPVAEFLRAAGLKTMSSLDPFLPLIEPRQDDELSPSLRGMNY